MAFTRYASLTGRTVVIDGTQGCVIIDPCPETIRDYEVRRDALARER